MTKKKYMCAIRIPKDVPNLKFFGNAVVIIGIIWWQIYCDNEVCLYYHIDYIILLICMLNVKQNEQTHIF